MFSHKSLYACVPDFVIHIVCAYACIHMYCACEYVWVHVFVFLSTHLYACLPVFVCMNVCVYICAHNRTCAYVFR